MFGLGLAREVDQVLDVRAKDELDERPLRPSAVVERSRRRDAGVDAGLGGKDAEVSLLAVDGEDVRDVSGRRGGLASREQPDESVVELAQRNHRLCRVLGRVRDAVEQGVELGVSGGDHVSGPDGSSPCRGRAVELEAEWEWLVLDPKALDRDHRPVARRGRLGLDGVEIRQAAGAHPVPVVADLVQERVDERLRVEPPGDVVPQLVRCRQVGPGVRVRGREVAGQLRLAEAEPLHQRFDVSDFHGIPLASEERGTWPARIRPGRAGRRCHRRGCSRRLSSGPSGDRCPCRSGATRPCG